MKEAVVSEIRTKLANGYFPPLSTADPFSVRIGGATLEEERARHELQRDMNTDRQRGMRVVTFVSSVASMYFDNAQCAGD